ncbi:Rab geranylgeranyltransferase [Elasticomyces elasticus]|uniref:Geranylgeranyl transferase type-2 subunit alpha n=1 Tax=Exophiala sideris TaxID=1016849 RepID=A0ABR0JQ47_9EURO|nr:Rab geranylgeranyltransferase [Elasticomyces elasticus]KAK5039713.1 Rab geranylgeranyltransferase [Exophiala sideris]KAK5041265.1 Rab geranylgeranyltransferase [Exophiala sideris]KAK5068091.1 Rab geranylgeranyltransferase [Exophiala sideris]KAK5187392.1 Rab geranylgeranyltransferase [Eurotiomycetes sp. CCFEE 6388]
MLSRDSRNFHGWGYRRIVVSSLESSALQGQSMSRSELEYTKKMIGTNLSNFSAWHNRSKLILKILDEEAASDNERKDMLDEELELIHKALFDPYDQSLWFYHQTLMCAFDSDQAEKSMAPNLSKDQRFEYIASEREYIEEVLEDAQDCKWVYQALIECTLLEAKLNNGLPDVDKTKVLTWINELKSRDPLRKGRWLDLERSLVKDT